MIKTAALLAFLMFSVSGAYAEDVATTGTTTEHGKIASVNYVAGALQAAKDYTDTKALTQGSNVTISDNKINVADATQTTKGVVKYGTIPTAAAGTGEALIWVE